MTRARSIAAAFRRLAGDETGTALVEYAIVSASLAVMMIAALKLIQNETGVQLSTAAAGLTAFAVTPP
jgi:Flp pilus assembly pilin Flp